MKLKRKGILNVQKQEKASPLDMRGKTYQSELIFHRPKVKPITFASNWRRGTRRLTVKIYGLLTKVLTEIIGHFPRTICG